MSDLYDWYVHNAPTLRAVAYIVVMMFFGIWGVWALSHGLYHRGSIKLLMGLTLLSLPLRIYTGDNRWSLWLTTPALVTLAIVVVIFLIRLPSQKPE